MKVPHTVTAASVVLTVFGLACAQQTASTATSPGRTSAPITGADLRSRLSVFSDDSMGGREAGTIGNYKGTEYLAAEAKRIGLEPGGENGGYFQNMLGTSARFPGTPNPEYARNVIAIIRGSDPVLRNEYVAIGAHNDAIGTRPATPMDHDSLRAFNIEVSRRIAQTGGRASRARRDSLRALITINVDSLRRLRPARRDSIVNGADDDGSGSVALLEIAEAIAAMPVKPKRSILFVWHTAEEKGLLGAKWFVEHPTVPRENIVAQLNLDMIGRGGAADIPGGGPEYLQLVGSRRLSTEFGDLVEAVNSGLPRPFKFDYQMDANGHPERIYCRSDHYHYARYGIPITFFTTGLHHDYHQITDELQYIDYEHLTRITGFIRDVAVRVANLDHRLKVDKPVGDPTAACVQ